ncbi:MAG: hypothetical protein JST78_09315 [Bacteroidetes bacterium]|nr:hypothetical protein [Bacteroidota bacterium]
MARVRIINEVSADEPNDWQLFFQWCEYIYDDGGSEYGYRFIWRRPDGSLQAARGQARIPDINSINELMELARVAGWLGSENN